MRSPGNEGAGPTDRHLRVQRSRRDQRLSRRPTARHQSARTVIDHRFRRCLSCGKHVSIPDDHQTAIRPHRQTMHRSDSRSTGRKGGTELLHSSHAARRTRKLRIASTAVVRQEHFTHSPFPAFIPFIPVDDMDQVKNIRDNGKSAITGTTLSTKHPCICNMPPS